MATRPARMADVAAKAGVSIAAVSHVLSGRPSWVGQATRRRVQRAAADLGYRPNVLAQSLRSRQTHTLGLIFPGMRNDYVLRTVEAIYDEARSRGYHVLMMPLEAADAAAHAAATAEMAARMVEGLFVHWPYGPWHRARKAIDAAVPQVLIDSPGTTRTGPGVRIDRRAGFRQATAALLASGRRRVAIALAREDGRVSQDKLAGWRDAHRAAGVRLDPRLVLWHTGVRERDVAQGRAFAAALLGRGPRRDALIATDDHHAIGALQAIEDAGLRVPDDIAVIGLNDTPACTLVRPALASIAFPIADMARTAIDLMLARLGGATPPAAARRLLPMSLIARDSM